MSDGVQMPQYECHKKVWALKIKNAERVNSNCTVTLTFEDGGYAPISADESLVYRYFPKSGDYYVVYEDGYKSISPAQAFEQGYKRIV